MALTQLYGKNSGVNAVLTGEMAASTMFNRKNSGVNADVPQKQQR